MLRTVILTSLVGAGVALAGVCENDVKIAAQADFNAIASCTTLGKDVTITTDDSVQTINLDKITNIGGNLFISGGAIASISLAGLAVINGVFSLTNLTKVGSVQAPNLINVGGIMFGPIGPSLQSLGFTKGISTVQGDVVITDTYLTTLTGISLTNVGTFNINNNRYLTAISQPLKSASKSIIIQSNARAISSGVSVSFPNLAWVPEAIFQQVANLSLPNLQHVNGSLGCTNNTFADFEAPKLTAADNAVYFNNGENLSKLSFPVLTSIGGDLSIVNNTELKTIDGFSSVKSVDGTVRFIGSFDNATLPKIEDIRGSFVVDTTSTTFDCAPINAYNGGVVKGNDSCVSQDANANSNTGGSPTGTTGSHGATNSPKSAGVHSSSISIMGAVIFAGVLALAL